MLTIGIDLAAEPKGTAVAQIDWSQGNARLIELAVGLNDQEIVSLARVSNKTGIDCALGWPKAFSEFIANHSTGMHLIDDSFGLIEWRRKVIYRETDRQTRETIGRWPLSVATDRLGVTALRCAGLVARLSEAGINVDRSGSAGIVEVYPAGSLQIWGFDKAGYRQSVEIRAKLIDELQLRAKWLDLGNYKQLMVQSCDALDAVVASLSTRASCIGKGSTPRSDQLDLAKVEGWISLPLVQLEELVEQRAT